MLIFLRGGTHDSGRLIAKYRHQSLDMTSIPGTGAYRDNLEGGCAAVRRVFGKRCAGCFSRVHNKFGAIKQRYIKLYHRLAFFLSFDVPVTFLIGSPPRGRIFCFI